MTNSRLGTLLLGWLAPSVACSSSNEAPSGEAPSYSRAYQEYSDWYCGCLDQLGGSVSGSECRAEWATEIADIACMEGVAETDYPSAREAFACEADAYAALTACKTPCSAEFFACADGSDVLDKWQVCDGEQDCPDGSDEPAGCEPVAHTCIDGTSLLPFQVCNGWPDCADESDEVGCAETCEYVADRALAQCPEIAIEVDTALGNACRE